MKMEKPKSAVDSKPSHFPCKCSRTRTISKDKSINGQDNQPKETTQKRPSSANSVKSSPTKKKSATSKLASSDTKIPTQASKNKTKKCFNFHRKKAIDPESSNQLKEELKAIKEQLTLLSNRKKETMEVTTELESRYRNLKCQCENQKNVIEELKTQNVQLREGQKIQATEKHEEGVMTSRTSLDEYEEKLNCLYQEFVETSKIMEESRNKICRCIKEKSIEYEEVLSSKNELCKSMEENNEKYKNLLSNYEQCKENEKKYAEQNSKLIQMLENLEKQLDAAMIQLDFSYQETVKLTENFKEELETQKKHFSIELESRTNEITELKTIIQQLESRLCPNKCKKGTKLLQNKYSQLETKYKHTVNKLNFFQQNYKKRNEEMEVLKKHEEDLLNQLVALQNFCNTLTNLTNEHTACVARLNQSSKEKDAIIKCQKAQMACKDKQIEILRKDEERLKQKLIEVQEEAVSLKISLESKNVLPSEEFPLQLTDELEDLITTLYEEIDKTLHKDEEIKNQKQEIWCLICALQSKERELSCVRNELEMLKNRFIPTSKGKGAVFDQFMARRWIHCQSSEEEQFCTDCGCNNL